jgi:hypothetical protein
MHVFLAQVGWRESLVVVIFAAIWLGLRLRRALHGR